MSIYQYIGSLLIAFFGVILFVFKQGQRKTILEHRQAMKGLYGKIEVEHDKQRKRFWRLNLYDFLRYNLKDALGKE